MASYHGQHYNLVAKKLRTHFPTDGNEHLQIVMRGLICELALDFARSFEEDNPNFDPIKFLDACSPDPDRYPMSELWNVEV